MKFYSGFSLSKDISLFEPYLKDSEFCLAGFSLGAIRAFEEVLASKTRIDTLQLFSPAFFQNKSDTFKRTQNMYFSKDREAYLKNFLSMCFLPAKIDTRIEVKEGSAEELQMLLSYVWKADALKALQDRGVEIEVYLGSEDKIIDAEAAKEFFLPYATTYMINHAGHTLTMKETNRWKLRSVL